MATERDPTEMAAQAIPQPTSREDDLFGPDDHLAASIAAAKRGDLVTVRKLLQVPSVAAGDEELVKAMMSLERGLENARLGRAIEAVEQLELASAVISSGGNEAATAAVWAIGEYQKGGASLLSGNPHQAVEHLGNFAEALETSSFYDPELLKRARLSRMEASIAAASISVAIGDVAEMQRWFGRIRRDREDLLTLLDGEDPSDMSIRGVADGYILEIALQSAREDLYALDFEAMRTRLESVKEDAEDLERLLSRGVVPIPEAFQCILSVYRAFVEAESLAAEVLLQRSAQTRERAGRFASLTTRLRALEDAAFDLGARGTRLLYAIRNLQRFLQNLLRIDSRGRKDFGRWGGIVSLAALVVYLVVVSLTLRPTGVAGVLYLLGGIIVALIAGFTFHALRFRPLIQLYADTANAIKTSGAPSREEGAPPN